MFKKHLQFTIAFAVIFIVQLLSIIDVHLTKLILADFHYLIKPLITISLMAYLGFTTKMKGRFVKRIFVGLLFSLFGDCFLMFEPIYPSFFMFGLFSFMIGNLINISAFYLDYKWNASIERSASILSLIIIALFCIGFYAYLRPHLASMQIPVLFYALIISLMAVMAVNRKSRVNITSYRFVLYGVILFLVSDSILAYNRFVFPFKYANVAVMATYMLAQYYITIGAIARKIKKQPVLIADVL